MTAVSEARATRRSAPLLERDGVLSELAALLEDTRHARGRVHLTEGQAGIGKAQLLGELQNPADAQGARALSALGGASSNVAVSADMRSAFLLRTYALDSMAQLYAYCRSCVIVSMRLQPGVDAASNVGRKSHRRP